MILRNYTPHTVKVITENQTFEYPSVGVARVKEITENIGDLSGVPLVKRRYGIVENLPEEKEDVMYIVSLLVFQSSNRTDLLCPDTGSDSVIRDEKGNIIVVKRLIIK